MTSPNSSIDAHAAIEVPVQMVHGKAYLKNAKGGLDPLEAVPARRRLEDETVRKVLGYAKPLGEEIARFREHTFDDVDAFVALLDQEYGVSRGGEKGNITLTSYDGCLRVKVSVADRIVFGPELKAAKSLIDNCLNRWSAESGAQLRTIVNRAFDVDKEGKLNHGALLSLLSLSFEGEEQDDEWDRGMQAIRDSIRVIGSKRYVTLHRRESVNAGWTQISIDIASA